MNLRGMNKLLVISFGLFLSGYQLTAQEIIPFPDLSEQYEHTKNGGKSLDERNYAMFSNDYQESLRAIDKKIDEITSQRSAETEQVKIDGFNRQIDALQNKRDVLLEEAELVEDLHKFY